MYSGLTTEEVRSRIEKGEVNGDEERMTSSYSDIVRHKSLTYFNFVNIVLFILVLITGRIHNGMFIMTVVFNTLIGIYQEIKAKKLLEKMSLMIATKIAVKRDGAWTQILASEIVRDDLIRLESGLQIPADGTVLSGSCEVNESMLTGEAETVLKKKDDEVFAGTFVTSGSCEVHITKVGKECASAKIMEDAKKYKRVRSMLHEDLTRLLRIISIAIIPTGIILYLTQHYSIGLTWQDADLKTVAAVVGMIPEGLVVLTSIALAVSTMRLSRQDVLVQDLYSIESLARVNCVCLDKTGTLTQGSMQVTEMRPLLDYEKSYAENVLSSCLHGEEKPNATSSAMLQFFGSEQVYEKTDNLPFSSDRKYSAAVLKGQGSFYIGAADFLFPHGCPAANHYLRGYAEKGMRNIVLARSRQESFTYGKLPEDLEPVALIAIADVLRENVREIMDYFCRQGVHLKVISGDDAATVSSLAVQAGIPDARSYIDMSRTDLSFDELVQRYSVFGRVLPAQKKELVEALQRAGYTVAMTGDGVNDVPALKTADVSVAMAAGASAAKDSANIVLLSDDFGKMPQIVDEGRRVINNISRASSMYLVKTVFSILLSLYVVFLQQEYPFLPIHLTLVSAVCVGMPTFFLQMEPSFERLQGRFFARAFRNALPSALSVFLSALVCLWLRYIFRLPIERYYGILISLTAYIYFYTLYRVYYPPTRLRIAVLCLMSGLFIAALFIFGELFSVRMDKTELLALIPGLILEPLLIASIAKLYDRAGSRFHQSVNRGTGKETMYDQRDRLASEK